MYQLANYKFYKPVWSSRKFKLMNLDDNFLQSGEQSGEILLNMMMEIFMVKESAPLFR